MTNSEIILRESMRLMEAGILSGSGRFGTITDADGTERKIELPEVIHTFAAWKQAGFSVKRGEHAIAAFPVWKYSERRSGTEADAEQEEQAEQAEQQTSGRMFMKKAFFFKASQVERITA